MTSYRPGSPLDAVRCAWRDLYRFTNHAQGHIPTAETGGFKRALFDRPAEFGLDYCGLLTVLKATF